MHYTYASTRVLNYGVNGHWESYTDPDQLLSDLLRTDLYKEAFIQIYPDQDPNGKFYVKASTVALLDIVIDRPLTDVFSMNEFEPTDLPSVVVPTGDIAYCGFHSCANKLLVTGFDSASNLVSQDTRLDDLDDIVLASRTSIDLSRLHSHAIAFVNGFAHLTSPSDEAVELLYFLGGAKTARISGFSRISYLDFDDVGALQQIPLKGLTLDTTIDSVLHGVVKIYRGDLDLTAHQPILSLGGYLIFPSPDVLWVDGNDVVVDLSQVQIEKKIVQASKYLDLSTLSLEDLISDPEHPDISILTSESVLSSFLDLPQSFLILVPKSKTIDYGVPIRRFEDKRAIFTSYRPTSLLRSSSGRVLDYYLDRGRRRDDNMVRMLDFMSEVDRSTSTLYPFLEKVYPLFKIQPYDVVNEFRCIGYMDA